VRDHDTTSYVEGLQFYNGLLYESAGEYKISTLREVDPETGKVLRSVNVPEQYFAEGIVIVGDKLIQLTWKEQVALIYDVNTFEQVGTYTYEGEGWGMCTDGQYIYMSNGSSFLALRDPDTFAVIFNALITFQGQPVNQINELECVGDYIYANIWKTDYIIKINKKNGVIVGLIDASSLLTEDERSKLGDQQVLNGIAYNADTDTFLITGKNWPKMFEVRFVPKPQE
jgi:glutaminyl-peptide cyclotransferase